MRLWVLCLSIGILSGQECRFTLLTPAQPPVPVEEGERATESQTFQTNIFAVSPEQTIYFFDTASRIRRITLAGRMETLAGNGTRAAALSDGVASQALPNVTQLLASPSGDLHFVALGRVFKVANGSIVTVAGTGRPGFNGESGIATEISLGGIVHAAFSNRGELLVVDGFNRLRLVSRDGQLRTVAGSSRPAAAAGLTGDNGPAAQASLSNPRQVIPLADGSLWVRDLGGRHLRLITADGLIRTVNTNFDTAINILLLADGTPAAATANRVFPIRADGNIETGRAPYPPFTGTPRAIAQNGDLYYEGSTRPDQRSPLVRIREGVSTVLAGSPVAEVVDGQAPPFGLFYARNNSLLYSASLGGKSGILEARPGQTPRFIVGGGGDIGSADGKPADSISLFGIQTFTVDPQGRIIIADANRRRILVVGTDGRVSYLKTADGSDVIFAPLGAFSTLQRIVADAAGNLYWNLATYTPTGAVQTVDLAVYDQSSRSISTATVPGLAGLVRLADGTALALSGNSANFRSALRLGPSGPGAAVANLRLLPLTSVALPYFVAAGRLFRGEPGRIEYLETPLTPDFVVTGNDVTMVHFTDGGFYRLDNPQACAWQPQPRVDAVTNAASFGFPDQFSTRGLLTIFGRGLGPSEGQGLNLDGLLRATGQSAPYPTLQFGNFTGALPQATLTGTGLPVLFSNDTQTNVAAPVTTAASFQLYFTWQGLTLFYPNPIRLLPATPGLFPAYSLPSRQHLVLYATGLGPIEGNLALGEFLPLSPLYAATNSVQALVDDEAVAVEFAGGAPGGISGLYQINLFKAGGFSPGTHRVVVVVAGQRSAPLEFRVD